MNYGEERYELGMVFCSVGVHSGVGGSAGLGSAETGCADLNVSEMFRAFGATVARE